MKFKLLLNLIFIFSIVSNKINFFQEVLSFHFLLDKKIKNLFYQPSRYYDPKLSRFINPDTVIPDPASTRAFNRYSYVYNDPLQYNDPSGHVPHRADDPSWLKNIVNSGIEAVQGIDQSLYATFSAGAEALTLDIKQDPIGSLFFFFGATKGAGKGKASGGGNAQRKGWEALGAGRGGFARGGTNASGRRGRVGRNSDRRSSFFTRSGVPKSTLVRARGIEELIFAFAEVGFIGRGASVGVRYVPTTFFTTKEALIFVTDKTKKQRFTILLNGDGSFHSLFFGDFSRRPAVDPASFDYEFRLAHKGKDKYAQSNPPHTIAEGLEMDASGFPSHSDFSVPQARSSDRQWQLVHVDRTRYNENVIPLGAIPGSGRFNAQYVERQSDGTAIISDDPDDYKVRGD